MNKLAVILIGTLFLTGCAELNKIVDEMRARFTPAEVPAEVK